jgi:hypothetical protein
MAVQGLVPSEGPANGSTSEPSAGLLQGGWLKRGFFSLVAFAEAHS